MKINMKSQLAILFEQNKLFKEQILNDHLKRKEAERISVGAKWNELHLKHMEKVKDIFKEEKNKNDLIAGTVVDMAHRIRLANNFDFKILSQVPEQKSTYMLGSQNMLRFIKENEMVYCFYLFLDKNTSHVRYSFFNINTSSGEVSASEDEFTVDCIDKFLRLVIFIEMSKIETKILKPNEKTGTIKTGKYINVHIKNVTIVDSSWNKYVIRAHGFVVSGHFRLQPYGAERKLRRLIFIEEFVKSGYVRRPKKRNE
jgi:hypothetical protein